MLPKNKRLTKALFNTIMKEGLLIHSPVFLFRFIKGKDTRIAFVAPKSVVKTAVKRNRLRRLGYNSLISLSHSPSPLVPIRGIFFYKNGMSMVNKEEVASSISEIFSKIK